MNSRKDIALVIGNGPSVDQLDGDTLARFTSFGANHIYKKFASWERPTDHVVITDSNRINEIAHAYTDFKGDLFVGDERKIFPSYERTKALLGRDFIPLRQLIKPKFPKHPFFEKITFHHYLYPLVFDKIRFPISFEAGLNFGYSVVSSAIQIAVLRGFKTILLTGVDTSYPTPKSYFAGMEDKIQWVNAAFIENPRLWMEPVLVNLQICLEDKGVEIIDCTPGGKLRFIKKGTLADY